MAIWNFITEKDINLIKLCQHTSKELAQILERHPSTISKIARQIGVKLPKSYPRKYPIKEDLFDDLTENSVYLLGFIAADGSILESRGHPSVLEIALAEKDKYHLIKLRNLICEDIPVRLKEKYKAVVCSFCSVKLVENLSKFGIVPRKSLTLQFPKNIPNNLIRHFVRGYFDGDGHVRQRINKRYGHEYPALEFSMLGTKDFLIDIKRFFCLEYAKDVGCLEDLNNYGKNVFRLTFSTRSAREFGNWIYKDCTIKLDRKFDVYNNFMTNVWKNKNADIPPV